MVRIETDPAFVNRIANSDAVRPYVHTRSEPMDWSPIVGKPITQTGTVALSNGKDAVAMFEMTAPGIYQVHAMFADTCRGKRASETMGEMFDWAWSHGANVLWTSIPKTNEKAIWFARHMGMTPLASSDDTDENLEIRKPH